MTRRAALLAALAALLPASASGASNGGGSGGEYYVVRPDPRACPSPLCGGYWVTLANHAQTTCADGARRPRCYVGRALDPERRELARGLPDGALVLGALERWPDEPWKLDQLVVHSTRAPVGAGTRGTYFRVRDLGIRCVRAPCYHLRAVRLNGASRRLLSNLDLVSLIRPTRSQLARANAAIRTRSGLMLLGAVVETSDAGTILRASRLYLTAT